MVKADEAIYQMRVLDRKFRRSCHQVSLLNQRIKDKKTRYDRASRGNLRTFRHTLRIQLATLENMRDAFYEYAARRADELDALQDVLVEAGVLSDTEEDLLWNEGE